VKAGDKVWVDAQEIKILKGQGQGRLFTYNTGIIEVNGLIWPDDTIVPDSTVVVKVDPAVWRPLLDTEIQRPWRYPHFRRLLAVTRSWTGDWLHHARKQHRGLVDVTELETEDDNETINGGHND